jgi:hypothetical protein
LFQLLDQRLHHHIQLGSGLSEPGTMSHRNICSYFMQSAGGRLYGIAMTGQQE